MARPNPCPAIGLESWLQQEYQSLVSELHEVLDLDTGLHDIRIDRQHAAVGRELGAVLDLDAGLADILSAATGVSPGAAELRSSPSEAAFLLAAAILDARSNRAVRAGVRVLAHVRMAVQHADAFPDARGRAPASDLAEAIQYTRDRDLVRARDLANKLADAFTGAGELANIRDVNHTLARALRRDLDRARALADELTREVASALVLADRLTRSIDRFFAFAEDLADALDKDHADVRSLTHALTRAPARTLASASARAAAFSSTLVLAQALARAPSDALANDLVAGLSRASGHARGLTYDLTNALADHGADAEALANPIARLLADDETGTLTSTFQRVIDRNLSHTLALDIPGLDLTPLAPAEIARLLDDFTRADLSGVELAGIDLTGVLWSKATRWPPSISVGELRGRSRETQPGSGVFEIVGTGNSSSRALRA